MSKASELEKRLIKFSVDVSSVLNNLIDDPEYNHLVAQIRRSAASPALNYGEAQSAESRKDFIHKLSIVLKELRETYNALRILAGLKRISVDNPILTECNELVAIFVASVKTAQRTRKPGV